TDTNVARSHGLVFTNLKTQVFKPLKSCAGKEESLRKGNGDFLHDDDKTAAFEIIIVCDEKYPHTQFLRQADYHQEERITKDDAKSLAQDIGEFSQSQPDETCEPTIAVFYTYNSDTRVWDRYFFGIDEKKEMFFDRDKAESSAQYDLEYQYKVELTRTKSEYV